MIAGIEEYGGVHEHSTSRIDCHEIIVVRPDSVHEKLQVQAGR